MSQSGISHLALRVHASEHLLQISVIEGTWCISLFPFPLHVSHSPLKVSYE